METMAFLVLAILTVLLGLSHAELATSSVEDNSTITQGTVTGADGKPCDPAGGGGEGEANSCKLSTTVATKTSTSTTEILKIVSTKTNEELGSTDPIKAEQPSSIPCDLQHFMQKECNSTCDSDICSDSENYKTNICNSTGMQCSMCSEILGKYAGKCFPSMNNSAASTGPTMTSSAANRSNFSPSISSPTSLSLPTITIAITTMAVVLILAVLILVAFILWLVFRHKTKNIQQRHKESLDVERYVCKEMETLSVAENKDPLYDTIDDTIISMPAHQTSFTIGLQPSLPIPTRNEENRHFENTMTSQPNRTPLLYEEPASSLTNFQESCSKGKNVSPYNKSSLENEILQEADFTGLNKNTNNRNFTVAAPISLSPEVLSPSVPDYALLEGPAYTTPAKSEDVENTGSDSTTRKETTTTTLLQNGDRKQTLDIPTSTTALYTVLERPTYSLSDVQPYECPNSTPSTFPNSAYGTGLHEPSTTLESTNISAD